MYKVRRRQGHDIRFGDHARKLSRLRKHDMPQVLRNASVIVSLDDKEIVTHEFAKHVHDEL